MTTDMAPALLAGKKGLVIGIANADSIAWGCARALHQAGAELAITYLNDKAEPHVRPLAAQLHSPIVMPLDVQNDSEMSELFERIGTQWKRLDFVVHAIAFAPQTDLHARVVDCSREGFATAMDISCHSFIRMAHLAEPLMSAGGCLLTMTYYGGEKVVAHYGLMGPVKAALESTVKYLAAELGGRGIRVNALSPGPIVTRAAKGIAQFDELLAAAHERAPEHATVCIDCVGAFARFLVSDEARLVTGGIHYVDAGFNIMAP